MSQRENTLNLVWDVGTLTWVRMNQPILNAGSVTVSGTVTANLGAVDNAVLDAIQVGVENPPVPGLDIPIHDYIALSYTGSNLTSVVYKTGGAGGTTVATLTLTYTGSQLDSVTKSYWRTSLTPFWEDSIGPLMALPIMVC